VNYERTRDPDAMREVKLDRMRRLCQRLGDPQRWFRSVLVAGTNGKGSVCAMLYSMLRESALRVGLYTSPHIEHVRERVRAWTDGPTDGERKHGDDWISETDFAAIVREIRGVLEDSPAADTPTYFEILTVLALLYFKQQRVEVAVLEVGMGGRLDATNVVEQAVSVITPIDLDHTDVLGTRLEDIAREKAGIIKPGQVVISARQADEAAAVLAQVCAEQGAPLYTSGRDLTVAIHEHTLDGLVVTLTGLRGLYESLEIPVPGRHQAENAALAIGALEALAFNGMPYELIERGLSRVVWPGRTEVVHESPLVIMDGAHNAHAAKALAQLLVELCPDKRLHLLIGMSRDKSPEAIGSLLGGLAVSATCTKSRNPRAWNPMQLAEHLAPFCSDVHVMSDPADAYTYLLNAAPPGDLILVTGSLFLVGELRGALRQAHVRPRRADVQAAT
jgi:dihydrofolate synthase/folylpolyglutamate synthase